MVGSTEPLVSLLGERLADPGAESTVMLEVLARRYYGNKDLTDLQARRAAGCTYVTAQRRGTTLVSAATSFAGLDQAICGLVELIDVTSSVDADIYVSWEDQPDDFDEMAAALQNIVSARMLPTRCTV